MVVALDADHRVKKAVDDQAASGDRAGDRIDEKRHVVVDDADAHAAAAELSADRFQPDQSDAGRTAGGAGGDELGRGATVAFVEAFQLVSQRALAQGRRETIDQGIRDLGRPRAGRTRVSPA